jgi:hypothetical protein
MKKTNPVVVARMAANKSKAKAKAAQAQQQAQQPAPQPQESKKNETATIFGGAKGPAQDKSVVPNPKVVAAKMREGGNDGTNVKPIKKGAISMAPPAAPKKSAAPKLPSAPKPGAIAKPATGAAPAKPPAMGAGKPAPNLKTEMKKEMKKDLTWSPHSKPIGPMPSPFDGPPPIPAPKPGVASLANTHAAKAAVASRQAQAASNQLTIADLGHFAQQSAAAKTHPALRDPKTFASAAKAVTPTAVKLPGAHLTGKKTPPPIPADAKAKKV